MEAPAGFVEEVRSCLRFDIGLNRSTAIFTDHQVEPAIRELIAFVDLESNRFKVGVQRQLHFRSDLSKGKWCDTAPFLLGCVKIAGIDSLLKPLDGRGRQVAKADPSPVVCSTREGSFET